MFLGKLAVVASVLFAGRSICFPTDVRPERRADLESFIASENTVALAGLLANIGSTGSKASGAASGIVVASPSKSNPDCETFPGLRFASLT